jgi:hypothetical protein
MALRKVVAVWLLLLAASPFTAPFSTCDLSSLSGGYAIAGRHVGQLSPSPETLVDEALAQLQSPESPAAGRAKFFVSTDAAALPHASLHLGVRANPPFDSSRLFSRSTCSPRLRI